MGKLHTVVFLIALVAVVSGLWVGKKKDFDTLLSDILTKVEDEIVEELTKPCDHCLDDALKKLSSDELAEGLTDESRDAMSPMRLPPLTSGILTDNKGAYCKFPWTYRGKEYNHCISTRHGGAWCGTGANYATDGQWGNCKLSGKVVTTDQGHHCNFPFTYRGKEYSTCIALRSDKAWCATGEDYAKDGKYGYCLRIDGTKCTGEDDGCCTKNTKCGDGEGDCDNDAECMKGTICGTDNCPWGDGDDCCTDVTGLRCKGIDNDCCTEASPCGHGDGDCDSDKECVKGSICGDDNCPWGDNDDCCTDVSHLRCKGDDNGCCTEANPCELGDGDCDNSKQCAGDMRCGTDNCPWGDNDDCCEERTKCTGEDSGCCVPGSECGVGEGDCDYDYDCQAGLTCGTNNCVGSTFQSSDDCCEGTPLLITEPALHPPEPQVQPPVQPAVQPAVQPPAIALAWKQVPGSKGCWTKCGGHGGKCGCGAEGWCCRKGRKDCPDEINAAGGDKGHTCVVPDGPAPPKFVSEKTCDQLYSKKECKAWAEKEGHKFAAVGGKSVSKFPAGCYVKYKKGTKEVAKAYFNKGNAASPECGTLKRDCVCKA